MRNFAVLIVLISFSFTAFAQKPKSEKKPASGSKFVKTAANVGNEKDEFDKAVAAENAVERISALQKFIANFPNSNEKSRAQELIVTARAAIGDEKLRLSETESGVELFKLAVKEAPETISDKFFSEILIQFPTNLFWRGQKEAAFEIARMIENKAENNAKQLLGLATFYIGIENAAEAERLANKALALDANLPAAYQTLALAHRVNFQLEESAKSYAKALELEPESIVSKRSLADMKRAVGKPEESVALYREILAKDETDNLARAGLSLALFDAGKRAEAESEMAKALAANPNNLPLLVGAAYWYAANNDGEKAVELASKAVEIEPRYTWAHIALARGYIQQKRPLEAERTLLAARQHGNFPTLDYELAAARAAAGFYREATDILRKNFSVKGDAVETRLGGRLSKEAKNFIELLDLERRASIFQFSSADTAETAEKLKALLDFNQKLEAANMDETEIARAADEFVKGDDRMKIHRQLFVANRLLQADKSLSKALELTEAAVGKTDTALEVPNASAAVLADELYESRTLAATRNQLILVPEIPRQTLSAILRGRIEEISGWTLFRQNKPADAVIRLKRAVSVLPEKSAWWHSSMWRLGASLEADGKDKEALDAYIKGFPKESFDSVKYSVIESLYQKVHGNTEGLESALNSNFSASLIVAKDAKPIVQTRQIAERVNPKTESSPALIDSKVVPESIPSNRIASQTPGRTRFPRGVPVKIETEKPSETATAVSLPVKTEEKLNVETEKTAPAVALSSENKPIPDAEKTVPTEEKSIPITEKSISSEEKPTVAEEKTASEAKKAIDEKSTDEEKKIINEKTTNEEKKIVEEKPVNEEKTTEEKAVTNEEKSKPAESNPEVVEKKPEIVEEKPERVKETPTLNIQNSTVPGSKPAVENVEKTNTTVSEEVKADTEQPVIYKNHYPPSPKTLTERKAINNQKSSSEKSAPAKKADTQTNTPKQLFEPVVITVPKTDAGKSPASETTVDTKKFVQQNNSKNENPETAATDKQKTEEKSRAVDLNETPLIEKAADENKSSAPSRPRVIVTDKTPSASATTPQCTIEVGQENISLLGGGGSLGILVGYKGEGDLKQLKGVSESPDDIEVIHDSEVGAIAGRAFFIVKSINTVKGSYKVTFEAPCGKKEITIKVR
ncbi:MAG TPA: hypothetical protein VF556_05320 [Pyrinomonadaceae bacterium]|jgi:tetratricopeptide (TPR) repeat protein